MRSADYIYITYPHKNRRLPAQRSSSAWPRTESLKTTINFHARARNSQRLGGSLASSVRLDQCLGRAEYSGHAVQMLYEILTSMDINISASKKSIRKFVITEKAPTRAFPWLKAATTALTLKTLLRHYANQTACPL